MWKYHKDNYRDVEMPETYNSISNRTFGKQPTSLPTDHKLINIKNIQPFEQDAINYLMSRGFNHKDIQGKFGLCSEYPNHLIVPIRNGVGTLTYWTGLMYREDYRKTIFPKNETDSTTKKEVIYNLHNAQRTNTVVLCEGVFDALSFQSAKINAVAIMGKSISTEQLLLLKESMFHTIIVALDGDAIVEAEKLLIKLSNVCLQVQIIRLPKELDPNDALRLGQLQYYYTHRESRGQGVKIKKIKRLT
jgi:hypothetical protein